ncbi:proline-rich receptor-like protein kinase PERK8 [Arachis stenosperma]|uniref:proline-rich receptor-like protein kinase PERK8 n=1 Tax=Arachis stenosperma TaxID=217475 RepID=UPI0025AC1DC5|nr:proline-rich receptor-like protein kinase PERK8 [Arachis stenosperma]
MESRTNDDYDESGTREGMSMVNETDDLSLVLIESTAQPPPHHHPDAATAPDAAAATPSPPFFSLFPLTSTLHHCPPQPPPTTAGHPAAPPSPPPTRSPPSSITTLNPLRHCPLNRHRDTVPRHRAGRRRSHLLPRSTPPAYQDR